jgi:TolA-binding protein
MRVVAHCKDVNGAKPQVVESLMRTASILERTKNSKAALELYQQVATQYADDPAAAKAQESVQRLSQQSSVEPADTVGLAARRE